jgi:hypothetical protein
MTFPRRAAAAAGALSVAAVLVASCGGGDEAPARTTPVASARPPTAVATSGGTAATPAATPAAAESPDGGAEVTGIIGAVNEAARTLEIRALRGAEVRTVEVSPATRIQRAGGGALQFGDLRASDRIVAEGVVDGAVMKATEITVQEVVPGSAPGG